MERVLFDSSIYIGAFRTADQGAVHVRRLAVGSAVWLSSVVLEELYAGAMGRSRREVTRLERDFDKARRIVVPSLRDWTEAGKVLAQLGAKYHYERVG